MSDLGLVELGLEVEEAQVHVAATQQVRRAGELVAEENLLLETKLHHGSGNQAGQADEALAFSGAFAFAFVSRRAADRLLALAFAFVDSRLQAALAQVVLAQPAVPALAGTCIHTTLANETRSRAGVCSSHRVCRTSRSCSPVCQSRKDSSAA